MLLPIAIGSHQGGNHSSKVGVRNRAKHEKKRRDESWEELDELLRRFVYNFELQIVQSGVYSWIGNLEITDLSIKTLNKCQTNMSSVQNGGNKKCVHNWGSKKCGVLTLRPSAVALLAATVYILELLHIRAAVFQSCCPGSNVAPWQLMNQSKTTGSLLK